MNMVSQYISNVVDMKSGKRLSEKEMEAMFHPFSPQYNPECDLQQVEPAAAIDIKEVYTSGIVPVAAPSFVDHYNDCNDPNAIVGRPRNDFDADRIVSAVNEGIREAAAKTES